MAISTHVLDATTGRPAAGLGLALSRRDDDGWRFLDHRETGPDGWLRVSIGTPDEMAAFEQALDNVVATEGIPS